VIVRARALGITTFETADIYGDGTVEGCLRELLDSDERAIVVTKVGTDTNARPPRKRFDINWLEQQLAQTRARLGPNLRCVVLLHNPSFIRAEVVALMHRTVQHGQFHAWGVSAGSAELARAAVSADVPVLEIAFNLLWTEEYASVAAEAQGHRVGLLARSVLAHGLLGRRFPRDHEFPASDHRSLRWSAEDLALRLEQVERLHGHAEANGSTIRALALRYVLSSPGVSSVVLGPRSTLQLDQLLRDAARGDLEPEARQALENLIDPSEREWTG
jgi:aryl-alcohol dehydrogenase-like predicted oxidoreductase